MLCKKQPPAAAGHGLGESKETVKPNNNFKDATEKDLERLWSASKLPENSL